MEKRGLPLSVLRPFIQQLQSIQDTLKEWEGTKQKVMEQIKSLQNLGEQLDAIRRCKAKSSMGVLSKFPGAVNCLEGKILASQERALGYIERDRKALSKLSANVQTKTRQAEVLLRGALVSISLEQCMERTAIQFSLFDYVQWMEDIRHIVSTDWAEMRAELVAVTDTPSLSGVTTDSYTRVYQTWELGGVRLQEIQQSISYSIKLNSNCPN